MLSVYSIKTIIQGLNQRFALDFNAISPGNYRAHIDRIASDEALIDGLQVFACYSRALSAPNMHVSNYIDQLARMAAEAYDIEALIQIDNLLYPDDFIHEDESDYLLSRYAQKQETFGEDSKRTQLYEDFRAHFLTRYYNFSKGLEFTKNNQLRGVNRYIDERIQRIAEGNEKTFTPQEYQVFREFYLAKCGNEDFFSNTLLKIYLLNPQALAGDQVSERATALTFEMAEHGIMSEDALACFACFASEETFHRYLSCMSDPNEINRFIKAVGIMDSYASRYDHSLKEKELDERMAHIIDKAYRFAAQLHGAKASIQLVAKATDGNMNVFDGPINFKKDLIIDRLVEEANQNSEVMDELINQFASQQSTKNMSHYLSQHALFSKALPKLSRSQRRELLSQDLGL